MKIRISYYDERKETAVEFDGAKHFLGLETPANEKLIEQVIEQFPITVDIGGDYDVYEINIAASAFTDKSVKLNDFCEVLRDAVEDALVKGGVRF